jgi:hypothetical protein
LNKSYLSNFYINIISQGKETNIFKTKRNTNKWSFFQCLVWNMNKWHVKNFLNVYKRIFFFILNTEIIISINFHFIPLKFWMLPVFENCFTGFTIFQSIKEMPYFYPKWSRYINVRRSSVIWYCLFHPLAQIDLMKLCLKKYFLILLYNRNWDLLRLRHFDNRNGPWFIFFNNRKRLYHKEINHM